MKKENNELQESKSFKHQERSAENVKLLQGRLNRIIGQLNGVKNMIEENRYCIDIITQLSACEKAIHSASLVVFKEHFETCVSEKIKSDDENVVEETMFILKTMK